MEKIQVPKPETCRSKYIRQASLINFQKNNKSVKKITKLELQK